MLVRRLRRRPNIKPALVQCHVFARCAPGTLQVGGDALLSQIVDSHKPPGLKQHYCGGQQ